VPQDEVRPVALKFSVKVRQPERAPVADRILDRGEGSKVIVVERRRPRLAVR
jgi:hypothetical protein